MASTRIKVRISPRSNENRITGMRGDAIAVRINAPPEKGKANKALRKFMAKQLGLRTGHIEIAAGHTSRSKLLAIDGLSKARVKAKLGVDDS